MTTESRPVPTVPLRVAFEVEVAGTPEQVWAAIATAQGLSAWFLPTDVEERAGGALVTHMGETDSPATITDWEPPHRLVYEEAEWAGLVGQATAPSPRSAASSSSRPAATAPASSRWSPALTARGPTGRPSS